MNLPDMGKDMGSLFGGGAMPKISERLSARKVESEKRSGYYADGGNLYLRIAPSGAKGWIFRFTHGGSTRDMGLGGYPKIGLADARDLAGKARVAVKQGIDPIERRKTERAAALAAKSAAKAKGLIFKDCARQHIAADGREAGQEEVGRFT